MKSKALLYTGILLLVSMTATTAYLLRTQFNDYFFQPSHSIIPKGEDDTSRIRTLATGLQVPWRLAVLPDSSLLTTERGGNLRRITSPSNTIAIEGVVQSGEGGLLGIALHPDFKENRYLYLYLTTRNDGGLINRVERYSYKDGRLSDKTPIVNDIPGAAYHDGGEIAFGPDRLLYIGTGDAGIEALAQDTASLAGKILRVADDGSIPQDNPFGNMVYSFGHRNVQGVSWDNQGRLWSVEHGPSGAQSGFDELNRIEKGANYGWPDIRGNQQKEGMVQPIVHSGSDDTWAPAGMVYAQGSLYFTGLRGQTLYEAKLNKAGDSVTLKRHLTGEYGRLRAVTIKNGSLIVSTSNTDGRGQPDDRDDRILEIPINALN